MDSLTDGYVRYRPTSDAKQQLKQLIALMLSAMAHIAVMEYTRKK